jgi:hypothetical protein
MLFLPLFFIKCVAVVFNDKLPEWKADIVSNSYMHLPFQNDSENAQKQEKPRKQAQLKDL